METERHGGILRGEEACLRGKELGVIDPRNLIVATIMREKNPPSNEKVRDIIKRSYRIVNVLDHRMEIGDQFRLGNPSPDEQKIRFLEKNKKGYIVFKQERWIDQFVTTAIRKLRSLTIIL